MRENCLEPCLCIRGGKIDVPCNELDGGRERLYDDIGRFGGTAPCLMFRGIAYCINSQQLAIGHLPLGTKCPSALREYWEEEEEYADSEEETAGEGDFGSQEDIRGFEMI
jgi:hypothetical protein